MITLSLEKNSPATKESSSTLSAASLAPMPDTKDAAADLHCSSVGSAALPLPALTKAELKSAAKASSLGRKFGLNWLQIGRTKKRLQTLETVSLGDKRFIALVRVDDRQFLIGGAPSSVGLLTELAQEESFHQVLNEATEGMNVSLGAIAVKPEDSNLSTEEPIAPVLPVTLPEPATVSLQAQPQASFPVPRLEEEAVAQPAVDFDSAFMRAYRDMALAAAAGAISGPDTALDSLQSALKKTDTAALDLAKATAVSRERPVVHAQPNSTPGPESVVQTRRQNEPIEVPASTSTEFLPIPSFTFQTPSSRPPKQPEKPKAAVPVKAVPCFGAFTWSLTGATS